MHIAIIGGGISGLSLYLWLQKLNLTTTHTITIYEARAPDPTTNTNTNTSTPPKTQEESSNDVQTSNASLIGGALGFSPTGLRVLHRLDPTLEDEVLRTGHWMGRWRMSNARGWTLGETEVTEGGGGVFIGRNAFWGLLRRRVPDAVVVCGKKVVDVRTAHGGDSGLCRVTFKDGSEVQADLVVGCDGIWSSVRTAVLGEPVAPTYEGLTGVGGFVPSSKLTGIPDGTMNVVFGANGFFGYGYSSSDENDPRKPGTEASWWSTYTLAECPPDWRSIDREDAKRQLETRHRGWKNEAIQRILHNVRIENVYPTFTTPDLPTWENGGCVLAGDAAHALQPSSGQGASMALEDSETLALLLAHHQAQDQNENQQNWRLATKQYSDMRIPRLRWIRHEAQKRSAMKHDMGFAQEMLMYFFIWLSGKMGLFTRYDRQLSEYDVPEEVRKAIEKYRQLYSGDFAGSHLSASM
ncbi:hypothetical protein Q7P37_005593 [Cladosporium fusiforme]